MVDAEMNQFERWFLRRLLRKLIIQGPTHQDNIIDLFKEIRFACEKEFTEDNRFTMDHNLTEWFEQSLVREKA